MSPEHPSQHLAKLGFSISYQSIKTLQPLSNMWYRNAFEVALEYFIMKYHAIVSKEKDWVAAVCPELDVASEGKTVEEALKNLKEAVELYLEDEDLKSIPIKEIQMRTLEISSQFF